eukprot:gene24215-biopygen20879
MQGGTGPVSPPPSFPLDPPTPANWAHRWSLRKKLVPLRPSRFRVHPFHSGPSSGFRWQVAAPAWSTRQCTDTEQFEWCRSVETERARTQICARHASISVEHYCPGLVLTESRDTRHVPGCIVSLHLHFGTGLGWPCVLGPCCPGGPCVTLHLFIHLSGWSQGPPVPQVAHWGRRFKEFKNEGLMSIQSLLCPAEPGQGAVCSLKGCLCKGGGAGCEGGGVHPAAAEAPAARIR